MPFSPDVKTRMFARCMRHCCLCRKQCGTNIEAAHIIDEAAGGPNDEGNGIPVCLDCHQEIGAYRDSHPKGNKFRPDELRARREKVYELVQSGQLGDRRGGIGGDGGGYGTIIGNNGTIIGGRGGDGGVSGVGGKGGGGGVIRGNNGFIRGGDGGSAATADGRGGRGARGPTERFGEPSALWGYGRGGSGRNQPEYNRRIALLKSIRLEYMTRFPEDVPYIEAGIDPVPVDWVNQRLAELGEPWRVEMGSSGYVLPALPAVEHSAKPSDGMA